jgi:hypothetical protein
VSVGANALIAVVGLGLPIVGVSDVQAAPAGAAHLSPPPPSPPPTSPVPTFNQIPDYNPGADGGGGGGGGG